LYFFDDDSAADANTTLAVGVDVGVIKERHCALLVGVDVGVCEICAWVRLAPDGNAKP
jgi:hypothetical protein